MLCACSSVCVDRVSRVTRHATTSTTMVQSARSGIVVSIICVFVLCLHYGVHRCAGASAGTWQSRQAAPVTPNGGSSSTGKEFTGKCHYCHAPGHMESECRKKAANKGSGKGSKAQVRLRSFSLLGVSFTSDYIRTKRGTSQMGKPDGAAAPKVLFAHGLFTRITTACALQVIWLRWPPHVKVCHLHILCKAQLE